MNANVNKGCGGSDRRGRDDERRPWQFAKVDVCLRNPGAAEGHRDRMATRVAGFGLPRRVVVARRGVVSLLGYSWMRVVVRRRAVMMIWMIVRRVFVHVHR